jgi:hypothetical protein
VPTVPRRRTPVVVHYFGESYESFIKGGAYVYYTLCRSMQWVSRAQRTKHRRVYASFWGTSEDFPLGSRSAVTQDARRVTCMECLVLQKDA